MPLSEAEKDARIKLLEEQRRRWFNRAWRLHDAIEEKDSAWAARVVEGWEADGETKKMRTDWIADADEVFVVASMLNDCGAFTATKDMLRFFEKPFDWTAERAKWIELGRPLDLSDEQKEAIIAAAGHERPSAA